MGQCIEDHHMILLILHIHYSLQLLPYFPNNYYRNCTFFFLFIFYLPSNQNPLELIIKLVGRKFLAPVVIVGMAIALLKNLLLISVSLLVFFLPRIYSIPIIDSIFNFWLQIDIFLHSHGLST